MHPTASLKTKNCLFISSPGWKKTPHIKVFDSDVDRKGYSGVISFCVRFTWPLTLSCPSLSPHTLICCRDNATRAASGWANAGSVHGTTNAYTLVRHKHGMFHPRVTGMDVGWVVKKSILGDFHVF